VSASSPGLLTPGTHPIGEHEVTELVEALSYKPEGGGLDFSMKSLDFSIDLIHPAALCPYVDSASNRNEKQEYYDG
jgi:hypothetical protein